ncbi:MAG: diphthine--ammonia ligase [Candidatus Heimdallarchaeaceae archaeon]
MRLAALFSGGKDSTYALYKVLKEGHEIVQLVTILPKRLDSWMFHRPCIELTKLQAEAMEIKHTMKETEGEKEKELEDLIDVLRKIKKNYEIDGVVSGAVASNYQKQRIDGICKRLGLKSVTPLWKMNQEELLREEVASGFRIVITSVSTAGLDKSWLGKEIDNKNVERLIELSRKYRFNPAFEGGEAETFVTDGPMFKKRIQLANINTIWDEKTISGYITAEGRLVEK